MLDRSYNYPTETIRTHYYKCNYRPESIRYVLMDRLVHEQRIIVKLCSSNIIKIILKA